MAEHKPTTDLKQAWMLGALLLGAVLFFGFIIIPYIAPKPAPSKLGPAPDFALPVLLPASAGERVRLADLSGKVVVLDFWASWCGPCKLQTPIVDRVGKKLGPEVVMLGVATSDTQQAAEAELKRTPVGYASVMDEAGEVARAYGAEGLPTLVIIGRDGQIRAVEQGLTREAALEELVRAAL